MRWFFIAATLMSLACAAHAQIGPPTPLGPPPENPVLPAPPAAAAAEPVEAPRAPKGIAADELAPPNPDAIGTLTAANAALPMTLWQDTSPALVLGLLPHLGSTTSPALQSLAFRLLASPATPPDGISPPGALLALRAERLSNALGRTDTALALLQGVPPDQQTEPMGEIAVDLAFLNGNGDAACQMIKQHNPAWQAPYWTQGMVTCQALAGAGPDAQLGLDILREAKVKDDGFSALVEKVLGNGGKLGDNLPSPQPMALALLGKAGLPLPRRALDSASLAVLRAVALSPGLPPDQRLDAAEKAATFGAITPDQLAAAYLALPLDPADLESPLNRAQAAVGSRGRAILFQASGEAPLQSKANFLVALLANCQRGDLYFAVVRAAEKLLLEVPAEPDLADAAPDFARAFYALDRPVDAMRWIEVGGPDVGTTLTPLGHIAAGDAAPPWGTTGLPQLLAGDGKDAGLALRRGVLAAQLLTAENTPPPDALIVALYDAKVGVPANVAPGVLIGAEAAAHHVGGTAAAVLAALGDQGANASGMTIAQAVAGLRQVGLADDARRLALDAAIAAGF